jgi:hypothetical protein
MDHLNIIAIHDALPIRTVHISLSCKPGVRVGHLTDTVAAARLRSFAAWQR